MTRTSTRANAATHADDSPAQEAWGLMRAITHDPRRMAQTHALMEEVGVTLGAVKALQLLPVNDAISMRKLAARLNCDNSYVTTLVDVLEERGLARRQAHPTDRRIKMIVLTENGRHLASRAQAMAATPPPGFAALSRQEAITLCTILRKLDTEERAELLR